LAPLILARTLWLSTRLVWHIEGGGKGGAEIDRAEGRRARLALHRLEVMAGAAEQIFRNRALDPALEHHRLRRPAGRTML
jgi:hypothetical protein